MRVAIVNGPNLGQLGCREPSLYGTETLSGILARVRAYAAERHVEVEDFQSNHEGALIDFLEERGPLLDGVVLNAGALTHYGLSLRDAVAALRCPVVEVHLTNVHRREPFRRRSVLSAVSAGQIVGFGAPGYLLAIDGLLALHARGVDAATSNKGGEAP